MDAPTFRTFAVEVTSVRRLCPSFVRVTFGSDDLVDFGACGADQRIKVVLPAPGTTADELVETCRGWGEQWYPQWLRAPAEHRPLLRTYTVRAARPSRGEVDVDFVLHGTGGALDGSAGSGPASRWAAGARVGDRLVVVGPDRPGEGRAWGREWAPPPGGRLLLVGDETAVPAACAVLEALEPEAARRTVALLEVPCPEDALQPVASGGAQVRWLPRRGPAGEVAHGSLLVNAVASLIAGEAPSPLPLLHAGAGEPDDSDLEILWDVPEAVSSGDLYAWVAGEAGLVRDVRRLVRSAGLPRTSLAAMGYWRAGHSDAA
ncbi:NADPH-dependent ferric siderophore reductase, contains FAD-binding and SIP domains [Quadrisphaera granulorum]|uniref:NADPH-dependent ferric siderophore reductase n=1 Tax=Quadrisphaera granulorum TaxID=317664 RepID=A0A316A8Y7_9ACTN|nr:siderophore-interacting protein [Quadrisphaera granulorum]PWJ53314.1 NADPH-dependent ferric siderophore reductase [Quadrisphaera granulorum]SZE96988.1 NADPH-dependent ferric siderophore reductase, contains FAD-binding and SIP domains [Quadrisphaera granulorum]